MVLGSSPMGGKGRKQDWTERKLVDNAVSTKVSADPMVSSEVKVIGGGA